MPKSTVLKGRGFSRAEQLLMFLSFPGDFGPRGISVFDFFRSLFSRAADIFYFFILSKLQPAKNLLPYISIRGFEPPSTQMMPRK